MDEFYRTYLAPYWIFVDLIWCALGFWCAFRPSMLVGPYGALVLTQDAARRFGLSPSLTERVLGIAHQHEKVKYDDRIGRIGGSACIAVGLLGMFTSIDPAVIASLAVIALAWTGALYSTSAHRGGVNGIASPDVRYRSRLVSVWVVGPLVIAAAAEMLLGTFVAIFVGISTLVIAAAIWWVASVPDVFFGVDALERHIAARFRLSHVATIVTFSPLTLLVWLLTSYADGSGSLRVQVARIVVEAAVFSQMALLFGASWRCNRDLRRIATGFSLASEGRRG